MIRINGANSYEKRGMFSPALVRLGCGIGEVLVVGVSMGACGAVYCAYRVRRLRSGAPQQQIRVW